VYSAQQVCWHVQGGLTREAVGGDEVFQRAGASDFFK
jgi:hypothetical protein